ncbi:MAG: cytochrome c [Betaproteobacteria bacterium]|nr:cytochrome c [Betaproteobacteria bacterium]MBI2509757.1 cytochrome c [Betaproteobacteria bacterium]
MNQKLFSAGLALLLGAGHGVTAFAQAKPEVLVKQRQAALTLQGKYFFGQLRPMAQGKTPYDANVVARNAVFLDALTQMPWDGFAPSTRDVKSGALPAVYTDTAKFKENQDRLRNEITRLVAVSKSGDEDAVKAQILAVNKVCLGCHETFREKQ